MKPIVKLYRVGEEGATYFKKQPILCLPQHRWWICLRMETNGEPFWTRGFLD